MLDAVEQGLALVGFGEQRVECVVTAAVLRVPAVAELGDAGLGDDGVDVDAQLQQLRDALFGKVVHGESSGSRMRDHLPLGV
ncbi:hypothetical protein [Nocardia farcinica]|uniref:hypothetical protein n=1 Tax=Nocardia farcinica TaxID=37329 RepID=UPI001893820E|nr:hypothetical protein [Nocardia farcinica]MBF6187973.1 hypothetical protein [Nocardia farcinica]